MQPSAFAVDQERGADLHHDAAEVGQGWELAGHGFTGGATPIVTPTCCLAWAFGLANIRYSPLAVRAITAATPVRPRASDWSRSSLRRRPRSMRAALG